MNEMKRKGGHTKQVKRGKKEKGMNKRRESSTKEWKRRGRKQESNKSESVLKRKGWTKKEERGKIIKIYGSDKEIYFMFCILQHTHPSSQYSQYYPVPGHPPHHHHPVLQVLSYTVLYCTLLYFTLVYFTVLYLHCIVWCY